MIKSVSGTTNWAKRAMMTALFAGTMTLGAGAANLNRQSNNTTTPTELVSKDAAAAMKANAISPQTTTQTVPDTHNIKLDKTLRKFIESEEDKAYYDDVINTSYENYGLYGGSAMIQNEIDIHILHAFLTGNAKLVKNKINPDFGREIEKQGTYINKSVIGKEEMETWLAEKYIPKITTLLNFNHKPTAEEVCKKLDDIAEKDVGFTRLEKALYFMNSDAYIKYNLKSNDSQSWADFAAYKMFLIDMTMMEKKLSKLGAFKNSSNENRKMDLKEYYRTFMFSVDPSNE